MEYIYSEIEPKTLLHLVCRLDKFEGRKNIAPDNEFLQLAALSMNKGQTFKPHKHIIFEKSTNIAQESWLVYKGKVKCVFYDLDDTILKEVILESGDLSMTFRGGHNYLILEDDTIVFEYKTGPYLGIENDKKFI
ncbi:MAG: hypothetical protein HGB12_05990 [Bacteroidetes bacterium]|nr:hypothetical protein [Bacteroidota bacterium]